MKERVQGAVTAGVAMVGAGVVALTPIAPAAPIAAPEAPAVQAVNANAVALMALGSPSLPEGLALSAQNLGSSLLSGAVGPLAIAQFLGEADGATKTKLYLTLQAYIDGPLFVIDPTLAAIDGALPAPIGQGTGDFQVDPVDSGVEAFRTNLLYAARQAARQVVADALGVNPTTGAPVAAANPAATLAIGLAGSAVRAGQVAIGVPLTPLAVAAGIAGGKSFNQALYDSIEANIDAPLFVADPTIDAVARVLPAPLGGTDGDRFNNTPADGDLVDFRDTTLLGVRDAIRAPFKQALLPTPVVTTKVAGPADKKALTSDVVETPTDAKTEVTPIVTTVAGSDGAAKHRKPTNNPIGSALKKLNADIKKALTPPKPKKEAAATSDNDSE